MSARQIHARLSAGWLTAVHQSVYLVGSAGASPEQAVLAACLATGSEAVASHRSAAALWGLRGVEAEGPEITLWADRHRPLHGVQVHRTRRARCSRHLPGPPDPGDHAGPYASRPRGGDAAPGRRVGARGCVAAPAGDLSALDQHAGAARWAGAERGRRAAGAGRGAGSGDGADAERAGGRAVAVLRRGGLPEPVRQYRVAGVVLDGAYPHIKLGLEADSRHLARWAARRAAQQRQANGWSPTGGGCCASPGRHDRGGRSTWSMRGRRELVMACPA